MVAIPFFTAGRFMSHLPTDTPHQQIISRAQGKALEQGFAVPGAINVPIKKAHTASLSSTDSLDLSEAAQPGGDIYELQATNSGLISFGGRVVLHDEGRHILGTIGVAAATVPDDQALALNGVGRV